MSATEILTLTVSIVCPLCSLIIAMVTMFNNNKKAVKQEEQKRGDAKRGRGKLKDGPYPL